MTAPRDSQRSKLYRAEDVLISHPDNTHYTLEEAQALVDLLMSRAWFKRRWPRLSKRGTIPVVKGRGYRARAHWQTWPGLTYWISLPSPVYRSSYVILHELAHVCCFDQYGVNNIPAHGREFAKTFLELVNWHMGKDAGDALRQSYKDHGVRYRKRPDRKPLSEDQRQVLRERMALARAARGQ